MSAIYFDGGALSAVDEWFDEGAPITNNNKTVKSTQIQPSVSQITTKSGLGYKKPKSNLKQQDELKSRIERQDKKNKDKKIIDEEDEGLEIDDLANNHGLVEDYSLSKSNMMNKKDKNSVPNTNSGKIKDKVGNKRDRETTVHPVEDIPSSAEQSPTKKPGYWTNKPVAGEGEGEGEEKRKRPKTRSKQKNIRKDSRPVHERPNFRPLTLETEAIIEKKGLHTKFD